MSSKIIQVNERPPLRQAIPLSIQHMFAMFGASVSVRSVFGIDPAIVLFMNGVGTLLFILITKRRPAGIPWLQFCLPSGRRGCDPKVWL